MFLFLVRRCARLKMRRREVRNGVEGSAAAQRGVDGQVPWSLWVAIR